MAGRAFTLIELLIVVAIIAILAAIAVPNFLEAQTRSKISRTVSDMRTVIGALEMYRVDNTKYIPAGPTGGKHQFWLVAETYDGQVTGVGYRLTTPVSYLTSIPYDVFNTGAYTFSFKRASIMYGAALAEPWTFLMQEPPTQVDITDSYYLYSVGPNGAPFGSQAQLSLVAYDPSNGTRSNGDIVYAGSRWISGAK